jgi:hypothetical protein
MGDGSAWVNLIRAVSSPLGMFVLLVLVLDAVLVAGAAATDRVPLWAPLGVLVLVVVLFVVTLWWKADVLYGPSKSVLVKLVFPDDVPAISIKLDKPRCAFEIEDGDGNIRAGRAAVVWGYGGWTFRVPVSSRPSESVSLVLFERNGRQWEVQSFDPFETVVHPTVEGT